MGSSSVEMQVLVLVVRKDGRLKEKVDDKSFAIDGGSSDAETVADTAGSGYDPGQSWEPAKIGHAASVLHVAPDYSRRTMAEPASAA